MGIANPMDTRRALAKGKGLGARLQRQSVNPNPTDRRIPGAIPGFGDVRDAQTLKKIRQAQARYDGVANTQNQHMSSVPRKKAPLRGSKRKPLRRPRALPNRGHVGYATGRKPQLN